MIAGFIEPTSGRILEDGQPISEPSADRGVVFQECGLFPWRTALQNVEFGPLVRRLPKQERRATAERFLTMVGLGEHGHKYPTELSGGMKQRVSIARVLANNPSVMLMDEPFGALDAQTREVMQEELLTIWMREQKTIVFVTHSVGESVFLADDIVIMTARPGRVKEVVPVDLPRPRDRISPEFITIQRHVEQLVKRKYGRSGSPEEVRSSWQWLEQPDPTSSSRRPGRGRLGSASAATPRFEPWRWCPSSPSGPRSPWPTRLPTGSAETLPAALGHRRPRRRDAGDRRAPKAHPGQPGPGVSRASRSAPPAAFCSAS